MARRLEFLPGIVKLHTDYGEGELLKKVSLIDPSNSFTLPIVSFQETIEGYTITQARGGEAYMMTKWDFLNVLKGLVKLHEFEIVQGDVKIGNMIKHNGVAKLIDFEHSYLKSMSMDDRTTEYLFWPCLSGDKYKHLFTLYAEECGWIVPQELLDCFVDNIDMCLDSWGFVITLALSYREVYLPLVVKCINERMSIDYLYDLFLATLIEEGTVPKSYLDMDFCETKIKFKHSDERVFKTRPDMSFGDMSIHSECIFSSNNYQVFITKTQYLMFFIKKGRPSLSAHPI